MASALDLLTRLYDATECLSDGMCEHEDEPCIVCQVGNYFERRYATARELNALRSFVDKIREASTHRRNGYTVHDVWAEVEDALKELDAARGGES